MLGPLAGGKMTLSRFGKLSKQYLVRSVPGKVNYFSGGLASAGASMSFDNFYVCLV